MSASTPEAPVDGRVARRQRNIEAVLDVVLEMFGEGSLFPTMDEVANRSGLSLRSLYRYFATPADLLEGAVARSFELSFDLARLESIGEGPLDDRIRDLVRARLRLHAARGANYRATVANAQRLPRLGLELARARGLFRDQFTKQFAPELSELRGVAREDALSAGDLLTQLDSIEILVNARGMSARAIERLLTTSLRALLLP